ncbi:hypothetical protein C7S15_6288 [Burkholderia cepacia]|nr:hypothetical protein [Burkholderia cepacia]
MRAGCRGCRPVRQASWCVARPTARQVRFDRSGKNEAMRIFRLYYVNLS